MKRLCVVLCLAAAALFCRVTFSSAQNEKMTENEMRISVTVSGKQFSAVLFQTKAAQEFAEKLPLVLRMRDYNANEKFCGLPHAFTLEKVRPAVLKKGDIMLFGKNTLVIFYDDVMQNVYSYTRIGKIEDAEELAEAVKEYEITVRFEKQGKSW